MIKADLIVQRKQRGTQVLPSRVAFAVMSRAESFQVLFRNFLVGNVYGERREVEKERPVLLPPVALEKLESIPSFHFRQVRTIHTDIG